MRTFGYIAYSNEGKRKSGTIIADTEVHAARLLKSQGLFVSELNARAVKRGRGSGWRHRLNADMQAVFTRQMAVLLSADLPIEAALEAVRSSAASPSIDAIASRAKAALLDGQPLSEALDNSGAGFPRYYIASVRAGESSGDVDTVFSELADYLESVGIDRAQISTALIYPGFVAAVSLIVCAILLTSVAPEIVSMFEASNRPLPELTQNMLAISDWITEYRVPLLAGAAGLVILWPLSMRIRRVRNLRDTVFLHLPLVGSLMRQSASVQYLRTLALVLTSKYAVLNAVDSAADVLVIEKFQTEAAAVSEAIRSGAGLSEALQPLSIIPPVARQLIGAGEQSAKLARMTERSAILVENSLSNERKRIAALLEPILMIVVGAGVLVIVMSVLLPIFDLQSVITP